MAISPGRIKDYIGEINSCIYNDNGAMSTTKAPSSGTLIVGITRDFDKLENKIILCDVDWGDGVELEESEKLKVEGKLPKVVDDLYEDFGVDDYNGIVGEHVMGRYFLGKLVGFYKIEK